MNHRLFVLGAAAAMSMFLSACNTTAEASQDAVLAIAKANPDCVRLTLHCRHEAGGDATVCASTDAARVGTPSDPEDLRAMDTGETVVLDEGENLDVTVPLTNGAAGACTTVCGVTLRPGDRTREQTVAQAKAIAAAVEKQLGGACSCCAEPR